MKPAVPDPAAALQEDGGVRPALPGPYVEPDEPAPAVTPEPIVVPYSDFLEHRRRRYGVASEFVRQDVEGSRT